MVEEIDLRPYLAALIRHWKWVIGTAVLVALVTFVATSLIPKTYRAVAVIAVTNSQQVTLSSLTTEEVAPRFNAINQGTPLYKAYLDVATNDDLMRQVLLELQPSMNGITKLEDLRSHISATFGADTAVIYLSAYADNPEDAALIVNIWAEKFVKWLNQVYGTQGSTSLAFYQAQIDLAAEELANAEENLIAFQSENAITTLTNQLHVFQQTQANYFVLQQSNILLLQDISALRNQIAAHSETNLATFAEQLTALSLQLKAFQAEPPHPLQVDTTAPLIFNNREDLLAFLDDLSGSIETKQKQLEIALDELEPEILTLQVKRQSIEIEAERLTRTKMEAQEVYTALSRKITEVSITSQDTGSGVKLASRASLPESPEDRNLLKTSIIASVSAGMLSAFFVLLRQWWYTNYSSLVIEL